VFFAERLDLLIDFFHWLTFTFRPLSWALRAVPAGEDQLDNNDKIMVDLAPGGFLLPPAASLRV